jgi:hypothetical protein
MSGSGKPPITGSGSTTDHGLPPLSGVCSVLLGLVIGRRSVKLMATAVLLTIPIRDFAIAAGLATAAFGVQETARPYGVFVLLWGTGAAGRLPQRS